MFNETLICVFHFTQIFVVSFDEPGTIKSTAAELQENEVTNTDPPPTAETNQKSENEGDDTKPLKDTGKQLTDSTQGRRIFKLKTISREVM